MAKIRRFSNDTETAFLGDCIEVLASNIPNGSIDLIFADPPYNIGKRFADFVDKWPSDEAYVEWCTTWLDLCIRKLRPNGSMYIMCSTQCMPHLDIYLRKRLTVLSRIVWCYDSSGVQAKTKFGSMYEPILHCVKNPKSYTFNAQNILVDAPTGAKRKLIDHRKVVPAVYSTQKVPGNAWYFPRVRYRMREYESHPAQKPEALLERVILASTSAGDTVLDPFSGTFTTSAVAQRLNRISIGIERELEYVKIGLRRLGIRKKLNGELLGQPEKNFVHKNRVDSPT